jgi:outer membrane protein assembly factor BamB
MRSRLVLVLAVLVAVAIVGALVHRPGKQSADPPTTTIAGPKPDPNRVVTLPGPLPGGLLIADRGNDRILLVDPNRQTLWRFPTAADRAQGRRLVFDDDTFVEPGGKALITNEEDHQDILSIDIATHAVTNLYGTPGVKGGGSNQLNWPDDAYVLPGGTMTVADAYNCRILFIRNHRIERQIGQTGVCVHDPPRTLGSVNGDTPLPGGGVLVSEINGSWIDRFSRTGRLIRSFQAPVSYPSDPQPLSRGRILLADYAKPGAVVILDQHGNVLWRYGPASGWGALDHPSLAIMLPNGNIAINDDFNDRVVIVDPRKRRIVWQYGHLGQPGRGGMSLRTPDGMDYIPLGPHEKPLWQLVHHP